LLIASPERNLRLGSVGGEDQVLHLTAAIAGTIQAEQLVVEAIVVVEGSDVAAA
jgi:tetrahydromethanopterin S-methyltransferase subunit A